MDNLKAILYDHFKYTTERVSKFLKTREYLLLLTMILIVVIYWLHVYPGLYPRILKIPKSYLQIKVVNCNVVTGLWFFVFMFSAKLLYVGRVIESDIRNLYQISEFLGMECETKSNPFSFLNAEIYFKFELIVILVVSIVIFYIVKDEIVFKILEFNRFTDATLGVVSVVFMLASNKLIYDLFKKIREKLPFLKR